MTVEVEVKDEKGLALLKLLDEMGIIRILSTNDDGSN